MKSFLVLLFGVMAGPVRAGAQGPEVTVVPVYRSSWRTCITIWEDGSGYRNEKTVKKYW